MTKIRKSDNTFTSDTKEIALEQAKFFGHLYKTKSQKNTKEIETYLDKVINVSLSETEKILCEGALTEEECLETLKTFSTNKTSGNDGISFEFYQTFWRRIKTPLIYSFNSAFKLGELGPSQRQAVITLIDKEKERTLIKNWRPISLLNTHYKIASKSIANRFKHLLPKLIHHNQTGFIENRNIQENLRVISDIFYYTK